MARNKECIKRNNTPTFKRNNTKIEINKYISINKRKTIEEKKVVVNNMVTVNSKINGDRKDGCYRIACKEETLTQNLYQKRASKYLREELNNLQQAQKKRKQDSQEKIQDIIEDDSRHTRTGLRAQQYTDMDPGHTNKGQSSKDVISKIGYNKEIHNKTKCKEEKSNKLVQSIVGKHSVKKLIAHSSLVLRIEEGVNQAPRVLEESSFKFSLNKEDLINNEQVLKRNKFDYTKAVETEGFSVCKPGSEVRNIEDLEKIFGSHKSWGYMKNIICNGGSY